MSEKNHESPNKEEKIPMGKIICAWCKKDMGEKATAEGLPTHGICEECAANLKKDIKEIKR